MNSHPRAVRLLAVALCAAGACASEPQSPSARLADAIGQTELARTFAFTLDGSGLIDRGEHHEDLNFAGSGEVVFPDRVHLTITIDQPSGGVRSELRHIGGVLFIRPATPGARWQRSASKVELAGFDPLAVFDFRTLQRTRTAVDGGSGKLVDVDVHKVRLKAKEDFRLKAQRNLPAGFEGTRLDIVTELWVSDATRRILRVVQRYQYTGATVGHFETDLRLKRFGDRISVGVPSDEELSSSPLVIQTPVPQSTG